MINQNYEEYINEKEYKNKIICCFISFTAFTVNGDVYAENITNNSSNVNYANISDEIARDVRKYHIPGMAVVVVDSDEILFSETYGNCKNIDTPF